jgi:hypothetical protein
MDRKTTTTSSYLFNPYYYRADSCWEIAPQEWAVIYFDHVSDWYTCSETKNHWNAFSIKKHAFFVLLNNSCTNLLNVSCGTSLLDILILPDMKSYIVPAPRTFDYSEELM